MSKQTPYYFTLFLLLFLFAIPLVFASEKDTPPSDLKTEIKEYIAHHLQDSHDFTLLSWTNDSGEKSYFGIPLPVIIWDEGLKVFSSAKFHHGETIATIGQNHYALYHGRIYKTDAAGIITYDEAHHPTNVAPLDFSLTKGVVSILVTALLMFLLFKKFSQLRMSRTD